jgi:hypothetical protein
MKTDSVNGHVLPHQLVRLTAAGQWGPSCPAADLSRLPIEDKDDLVFLDVREMIRNTHELRAALARGEGALLALIEGGTPVPGYLDVNQAVVIAATYGQEALALDYSVGESPRIVATCYRPDGTRWIEVARSFDDLLDLLKLSAT